MTKISSIQKKTIGLSILFFLMLFSVVQASHTGLERELTEKLDVISRESYEIYEEGEGSLLTGVSRFTNVIIGFLGVLAVVLILYAGFLWTTAGGNEEQVKKAKKIIVQTVIGIVIISAAFMIVMLVLRIIAPKIGQKPAEEEDKGSRSQPIHYLVDSNIY